jgi:hypothetical protein
MRKGQLLRHLAGKAEGGRHLRKVVGDFLWAGNLVEPAVDLDRVVLPRVFSQVRGRSPLRLRIDKAHPGKDILNEPDYENPQGASYRNDGIKGAAFSRRSSLIFILFLYTIDQFRCPRSLSSSWGESCHKCFYACVCFVECYIAAIIIYFDSYGNAGNERIEHFFGICC